MTDNHEYHTPQKGTQDWHVHLNENFDKIDTGVEVRDKEDTRDQYVPKAGAKFLATDTGKVFLGTGNNWEPVNQTGNDPSFTSIESQQSSVRNRDNEINVRSISGGTLRERLVTALDLIETSGRIRIPRPEGGGVWDWGTQLDIDVGQYRGITFDLDRGVEIEYSGDGWALTVDGFNGGQKSTFAIEGIDAEFRATGNPKGFIRSDDLRHFTVKTNTRAFKNRSGDATAILVRNVDRYSEGWKLAGDHRDNDRCIDFAPPSVTGGNGTSSFVDGRAENLSVSGNDFGIRLRGNHRSNIFDNVHFFFNSNTAVGLILDGLVSQTTFLGPRFDDTNGFGNEVGIETRSEFKSFDGKPLFISPEFSTVSTHAVKSNSTHDLWSIVTEGGRAGIVDMESGTGCFSRRDGSFVVQNESEPVFRVDGNGNVRKSGNWDTGSAPKFADSIKFPTLSADPSPPKGQAMFYVSDGSSGVTGGDGDVIVAVTNSNGKTESNILTKFNG